MDQRISGIIKGAKDTPFYKEVLIPELNRRMATYDELAATTDPWKRYGYVEAYLALKHFKLSLEAASSEEEEEIKQTPVLDGPAKIKGENYGR